MADTPVYFGYNPPFFGGHQNILSKQSGDRLIKNDLRQLLLTAVGERVMRPQWGTILKHSVFETITEELLDAIRSNLVEMITLYEPRIEASVSVTAGADNNSINVIVVGRYTDNPRKLLEFELNLPLSNNNG